MNVRGHLEKTRFLANPASPKKAQYALEEPFKQINPKSWDHVTEAIRNQPNAIEAYIAEATDSSVIIVHV